MTTNPFLRLAALACLSMLGSALAAEKPNVLLICVDDLKPLLGCYGDTKAITPNIDKLAARSTLFEKAYCNQAVCSPSRNALMTGLRPDTIGIYDLATNFRVAVPNAVTLPQAFIHAGYETTGLGKIYHVGHGNDNDAASWTIPHMVPKATAYALPENKTPERINPKSDRGPAIESADVPDETYLDGQVALEAIARLKQLKANPGKPFFLAVGIAKPHLPFIAPKKYWDLYQRAEIPLAAFRKAPEGAPAFAPQYGGELRQYFGIPDKGELPDDLQRELIHGYYAATSYADAQIGKVLQALEDLKLADNTIVVLWGDHGWHLGDHSMWCKHTNYEEANRIPFLISAPGTAPGAGKHSKAFAETVDLYPTLCELAGIPIPEKLDGVSLVNTLRDPKASTRDHVIHVYPRGEKIGRAIRTDRYRLVEWKVPGAAADTAILELYDYQKDPLETKNIASENPEAVLNLRKILAQYPEAKAPVKAAGSTKNPKPKKTATP